MKEVNYPIMYTCMPKLKPKQNQKYPTAQEEIECWVPTTCWILSKREQYCSDGTSFIDYEVVYRKDCHSLEVIDFPEERRIDTIVVKEEEEVSSNYEKIKFLCVERNKEILKSKFTPNSDEWKKIQYEFLEKEIKYFANSFSEEEQTIISKTKRKKENI